MNQTHAAKEKKTPRAQNTDHTEEQEDFERPDAATAAEGEAPYEHPAPSGADTRATRNDAEHGYSQDSGYATSGGPSRGDAKRPKRG
jgi:hypothetical protein